MITKEEWKPVAGWEESHEVSNIGRVRSIPRKGCSGRILSPVTRGKGDYVAVSISCKGTTTAIFVHRLVLTTFCGNPPPDGKSRKNGFSIKHKDGNNLNNHVDNLQWLTIENSKAFAAGGRRKAEVLRLIEPSPPEGEPMIKPNVFTIEVRCYDKLDPAKDASDYNQTLSVHSSLELAIAQCKFYATDGREYFDTASDNWHFAILECKQDPPETVLAFAMRFVMRLESNGEPFETEED